MVCYLHTILESQIFALVIAIKELTDHHYEEIGRVTN